MRQRGSASKAGMTGNSSSLHPSISPSSFIPFSSAASPPPTTSQCPHHSATKTPPPPSPLSMPSSLNYQPLIAQLSTPHHSVINPSPLSYQPRLLKPKALEEATQELTSELFGESVRRCPMEARVELKNLLGCAGPVCLGRICCGQLSSPVRSHQW
jgi:hypothetical protein